MAAKTTCTQEKAELIAKYVREGNTLRCAAQSVGVKWDTFKLWLRRGEEGDEPYLTLLTLTRAAEAEAERTQVGKVIEPVGDWKAHAWWLERRRWQTWWLAKPGKGVSKKPEDLGNPELGLALIAGLLKMAAQDPSLAANAMKQLQALSQPETKRDEPETDDEDED